MTAKTDPGWLWHDGVNQPKVKKQRSLLTEEKLHIQASGLLTELVAFPSFPTNDQQASFIAKFLEQHGVTANRQGGNLWAHNKFFAKEKPAILLSASFHGTRNRHPYSSDDPGTTGSGNNHAGMPASSSLRAMLGAFVHFYDRDDMNYNLVLAITTEQDLPDSGGLVSLLPLLPQIDCAIVAEPTSLQMVVAGSGLMMLDCNVLGRATSTAANEGENAIYKAMMDIEWIYTYRFPKVSEFLGPVKMTVTGIQSVTRPDDVVPSECNYVLDIRLNEAYSWQEIFSILTDNLQAGIHMRHHSVRPSMIPPGHPLVRAGTELGKIPSGSTSLSQMALMPFPAIKIGPGKPLHPGEANELVATHEIEEGLQLYFQLLNRLV